MKTKNLIYIKEYESPCGTLTLGSFNGKLCLGGWQAEAYRTRVAGRLKRMLHAEFREGTDPVIEEAASQLDDYFAGRRQTFSIGLLFAGTPFQQTVWSELLKIPYGETLSYGELAKRIGLPKAVRAVANANGANALSIFVPCHRVIGSDHSLTGYGGGLPAKRMLLELEHAL